MHRKRKKPPESIWRPLTGLPAGGETWTHPIYTELVKQWNDVKQELTDKKKDRTQLNTWLEERFRAFAIETGQIEGLYTLRPGVTEQLITEGLDSVAGSHTVENLEDKTIKGLLTDQREAIEKVFAHIKSGTLLGHEVLKDWHRLLTRHQEKVPTVRIVHGRPRRGFGPFIRKGEYKEIANNPRRPDGILHEYCPRGQTEAEMEKLFEYYEDLDKKDLPTPVLAGWLHHRFVRTHPFQDGNGRMSRLLVSLVYLKRGRFRR